MKTHKFKIETIATVQTIGDPKTATKVLFALHGYGQLSEFFSRKFSNMSPDYFIIVPEGPHRFYLEGSSGRVGASWMTKEKREEDILNYINYLNSVWLYFSEEFNFQEKILLGFSQGGATAARWHEKGNFGATKFILWGAVFPPDLSQNWNIKFNNTLNYFVVGTNDPYYSEEKIRSQIQYFEEKSVNFTSIMFDGKHEIENKTLLKICP
jgi:predicted esterase